MTFPVAPVSNLPRFHPASSGAPPPASTRDPPPPSASSPATAAAFPPHHPHHRRDPRSPAPPPLWRPAQIPATGRPPRPPRSRAMTGPPTSLPPPRSHLASNHLLRAAPRLLHRRRSATSLGASLLQPRRARPTERRTCISLLHSPAAGKPSAPLHDGRHLLARWRAILSPAETQDPRFSSLGPTFHLLVPATPLSCRTTVGD
ncbi:pistil-specific extensin-like protein [Triticum urartu]|uniref:pistil-specific extensin-like protein n=1 Tax=Triticum urartu TaxID=4572 RepID=UPI002043CE91|nr:pistil-specific extensin-like protein [Triticum urartu]